MAREFHEGDHVGQRGILDQIDKFVSTARQRPAHGLGQKNRKNGLRPAETEGTGGLELPVFNGEQSPPDIFRMIGPAAEGKPQDGGSIWRQIDAHPGQTEIP